MPAPRFTRERSRVREAAASLIRSTALDAVHELLLRQKWSTITMTDVAAAAGISRQTLYNQFGSRQNLAQSYALRLTDTCIDAVDYAVRQHPADVRAALSAGITALFDICLADPMVLSLQHEGTIGDLLPLVTTESAPIVTRATIGFSRTFHDSWIGARPHDAEILGRTIVRLALSYIARPPDDHETSALDLERLITPFVEEIRHK